MYAVVKRNKRLHVIDGEGMSVYSPHDFLNLPNRQVLVHLAFVFGAQGFVGGAALTLFERFYSTRQSKG